HFSPAASLFYRVEVVSKPAGVRHWDLIKQEKSYDWQDDEEQEMFNRFTNDSVHISMSSLLQLAKSQGLKVLHLLCIVHTATNKARYLAVLEDKRYLCDCCMPINLGIPCRHYFKAWTDVVGLPFHIGYVRPRWYADPTMDVASVGPVTRDDKHRHFITHHETLGARTVFHEAKAALRPLIAPIQTREELNDFVDRMEGKADRVGEDQAVMEEEELLLRELRAYDGVEDVVVRATTLETVPFPA
ncbi:hypothetical protein H0H93_001303, partial [Arthromyces matolae]